MLKRDSKQFFQEVSKGGWFLIVLGTIIWSLTMVKSGLCWNAKCASGVGFWGPNGHDGVWHIALIKSLAMGSWEMPVFAGENIKNYHIGFDILVAFLHKVTFIPIHILYFQIIPPILAFFIGYFVYKFTLSWRKSTLRAFWATFFVYFGGSWGWLVTFLRNGELGGESMFWSQQSISTLINPPFALSLLLVFAGLYCLTNYKKSQATSYLILSTILFGILIQLKVYAGILILAALFMSGLWSLFKNKESYLIKVFLGAFIISTLIFAPFLKGAGRTLIFKPFWFLETMLAFPDRFYWPKLGEAMVNYKLAGNFVKGIPAYLIAFAIFWFGNLGTRVVKEVLVFKWLKSFRKLTYMEVFFATVIVLGAVIPLFFIQAGTPWNTIQFMYYSLMFSGVLAGIAFGEYLDKKDVSLLYNSSTKVTMALFVVVLTLPTTLGTLGHYLPPRPPAKISNEELEALEFLSKQPDGVVLTFPFDRDAANAAVDNPPRPLYLYESTAYVSAFSGKPTYLEDEVNLEITGYNWPERHGKVEDFLNTLDQHEARLFLSENSINYIYWINGQKAKLGETQLGIESIYENEDAGIYRVN